MLHIIICISKSFKYIIIQEISFNVHSRFNHKTYIEDLNSLTRAILKRFGLSHLQESMQTLWLFHEAAPVKKSIKTRHIGPLCTLSLISRTCSSRKRPFLRECCVLRKHKARGESFPSALTTYASSAALPIV